MDRYGERDTALAQSISAMTEGEISQFIRRESRIGGLSKAVRSLNHDILSKDTERRKRAEAAIRKLGFI